MAKYEELFPNSDPRLHEPFDPIRPQVRRNAGGGRSALFAASAGDDAQLGGGDDLDGILNELRGMQSTAPAGETEWADYGKKFAAGTVELGSTALGIPEYGARKLAGAGETPFEQGMTDVVNSLAGTRGKVSGVAQGIRSTMTPEAQARAVREWTTLDPNRTIWQGDASEFISSLFLQAAEAAPSTLVTLLPGALMMRAGMTNGALAYLGASEGALSMGSIANNVADEIAQAPEDELMESPRYQQLRASMSQEQARQVLTQEAQGAAPLIAGTVVGLISRQAGRYLEPVFMPSSGAGFFSRVGRGFASEALQEGPQGVAEQLAQNIAAQIYDTGRAMDEGVLEAGVQGAAVGGVLGGATMAAIGPRRRREDTGLPEDGAPPPPPPVDPDIAAALTASQEPVSRPEYVDPYSGQHDMFPPAGQWDIDPRDAPPPPGMSPQEEQASYLKRPWPVQQGELDLEGPQPGPSGPGVMVPGEPQQLPLGLRARERGRPIIEPTPGVLATQEPGARPGDYMPAGRRPTRADFLRARTEQQAPSAFTDPDQMDLFAPQEPPDDGGGPPAPAASPMQRTLDGFAVRARNEQGQVVQEDIFATRDEANAAVDQIAGQNPDLFVTTEPVYSTSGQQRGVSPVPDEPSAEPLSDLTAQLEDLRDPDSTRLGVYLSRDNIRELRKNRSYEQVRGTGVMLGNFDGKGGTLIARDEATAKELLAMREQGTDMQELLGLATGAGTGKPMGDIVVQLRDEAGNVTRESLVASPEQADELVSRWEQETGQEAIILSSAAAIRRRGLKLRDEKAGAFKKNRKRELVSAVESAIPGDFGDLARDATVSRALRGSRSPLESGQKLMAEAASRERGRITRRVEGVDQPKDLRFKTFEQEQRYKKLHKEFTEAELRYELSLKPPNVAAPEQQLEYKAQIEQAKRRIAAFKKLYPPRTAGTSGFARAARELGVTEANIETRIEAADEVDELGDFEPLTDEQVKALSDEDLDVEFARAAERVSGERSRRSTQEERTGTGEERTAGRQVEASGRTFRELVESAPTRSQKSLLIRNLSRRMRDKQYGASKTKPITRTATTARGHVGGIKVLSDKEINDLGTLDVNREFRKVALHMVGKREKSTLSQESMAKIMREHPRVSDRREYLRRVHAKWREQGESRVPITQPIAQRKGKFNPNVLARTEPTKGELEASDAERAKQRTRHKNAVTKLQTSLTKSEATITKLAGEEGTFARAYLRTIIAYGQALASAKPQSYAGIEEMEIVAKTLNDLGGKPRNEQISTLNALMQAEEREQIDLTAKVHEAELRDLRNPAKRAEITARMIERMQAKVARLFRMEKIWGADPYYRSSVQPIVRKIASIVDAERTGHDPNIAYPTEQEMKGLRFAMRLLRKRFGENKALYEKMLEKRIADKVPITEREGRRYDERMADYTLLRRTLYDAGIRFNEKGDVIIPTDKDGSYAWTNDRVLDAIWRRRFGTSAETEFELPAVRQALSPDEFNKVRAEQVRRMRAVRSSDYVTPQGLERLQKVGLVDAAIHELRAAANDQKSNALNLLTAERKFVDAMKLAGLWKTTGLNGNLGRITLPGRNITVRLVGPRMQKGEFTVAETRQAMLDLYKPIPVSAETARDQVLTIKVAEDFKALQRQRTATYNKEERARLLNMTTEQRKVAEAYARRDRSSKTLKMIDADFTPDQQRAAGDRLQGVLDVGQDASLNDAMLAIWRETPRDSLSSQVAQRILDLDMDVTIGWVPGNTWDDPRVMGDYDIGTKQIRLNQNYFDAMRAKGFDPSAKLMSVILHEATHAATQSALQSNPQVKAAVRDLLNSVQEALEARGEKLPYGLTDEFEFVAEAFSNANFQGILREVLPVTGDSQKSFWQRFVDLVKRILGVTEEQSELGNALDGILSLTDDLFLGDSVVPTEVRERFQIMDAAAAKITDVIDRVEQGRKIRKSLEGRALEAKKSASSGLMSAMTLEQMRNFFGGYFTRSDTGTLLDMNPMEAWWRAFSKRGADNSESMEKADRYSRRWTTLTEENGAEQAAEVSRIMSEATRFGVHPDLPLVARENQHIQLSDELSRKHTHLMLRLDKLGPEWKSLYTDVRKFYADTLEREVDLATINALRAYLTSGRNPTYSQKEFDRRFPEGSVKRLRLNTKAGLRDAFREEDLSDSALDNVYRLSSIPALYKGPYFPLTRFGDYAVYSTRVADQKTFATRDDAMSERSRRAAADPSLDFSLEQDEDSRQWTLTVHESEFRLAETMTEARQNEAEMVKLYGRKATTPVQLRSKLLMNKQVITGDAGLRTLLDKLGDNEAAKAAIKDFYLRTLGERSFRKHESRRKNTRGVNDEIQHRAFQAYASSAAYYMAQLRHGWKLADAKAEMRKMVHDHRDESAISAIRMGQIVAEIELRDEMTTSAEEVSKVVRRGVEFSHFMLLTSPSYWMINASQPWLVTLPWLSARSSVSDAAAALANAQKLIASPLMNEAVNSWGGFKALKSKVAAEKAFTVLEQIIDPDEGTLVKKLGKEGAKPYLDLLQNLRRQGIIDLSFVAEIRSGAEGLDTSATQRVLDAARIMAHLTEVNNRILTAIAAYDLSRSKGTEHDAATAFAAQAVSLTQFNYSAGNKPRLFQAKGPLGKYAPLAFQFMQYPQHLYALMVGEYLKAVRSGGMERKVALKTLTGLVLSHLAVGGMIGTMLQPAKWALGMIFAAFSDDDDRWQDIASGETFDRHVRETTADVFGTEMGLLLSKGIPASLGADLSSRMSLGTLYFIDMKPETAESFWGSLVMSFGGPWPGLITNGYRGTQYLMEGETMKGLELFMPKGAKDFLRFTRYANDGLTTATGNQIIAAKDMQPMDLFLQSMGFAPTRVTETYEARAAIQTKQDQDEYNRQLLIRQFTQSKTPEDRAEAREAIREYNRAAPVVPITFETLLRSRAQARTRDRNTRRFGADLRGRRRQYAEEAEPYMIGE